MNREHPDRAAVAELFTPGALGLPQPAIEPQPFLHRIRWTLARWFSDWFGEQSFATEIVDLHPLRDRRIRLIEIALGGADRLNSRRFSWRHGNCLDLDETEIVTVLCETIRILDLEAPIRSALALRVSPHQDRNPDPSSHN